MFVCLSSQVEEATGGDGADRRGASEPDSQTRLHQVEILGGQKR